MKQITMTGVGEMNNDVATTYLITDRTRCRTRMGPPPRPRKRAPASETNHNLPPVTLPTRYLAMTVIILYMKGTMMTTINGRSRGAVANYLMMGRVQRHNLVEPPPRPKKEIPAD